MKNRREEIQRRKEMWLKEKKLEITRAKIREKKHQAELSEEEILSSITFDLEEKIRNEIMNSIGASEEKKKDPIFESFLSDEIFDERNLCIICFDIMNATDKKPIILFPCGHTFCEKCISIIVDNPNKRKNEKKCPSCRAVIEKQCINIPLKQMLENYAKTKENIKSIISDSKKDGTDNLEYILKKKQISHRYEEDKIRFEIREKAIKEKLMELELQLDEVQTKKGLLSKKLKGLRKEEEDLNHDINLLMNRMEEIAIEASKVKNDNENLVYIEKELHKKKSLLNITLENVHKQKTKSEHFSRIDSFEDILK